MAEEQKYVIPDESTVIIPACLDKESLQTILQETEKCDDLEVTKVDVTPGSSIGDNYLAIMHAVEIEARKSGQPTTYSIMAKVIPNNPMRQEIINNMGVFKKELSAYKDILPALALFEKSKGLESRGFQAYPNMVHGRCDGKTDYILMENLKKKGFVMGNRMDGMDYPQVRMVIVELAKLHALSYAFGKGNKSVLLETFPYLMEKFTDPSNAEAAAKFMDPTFASTIEKVRTMKGFEDVVDGMQKILGKPLGVMGACGDQVQKLDDGFAVICHGDCWINNVMFKYDSDGTGLQEVKLVDYQIIRVGSRTLDLAYLFCISTTDELRKNHQEDLFQTYHDTFVSFLKDAGVDSSRFTLQGLKKEYDEHFLFGFLSACLILPIITMEAENIPDIEQITEDEVKNMHTSEQFQSWFNTPRYCNRLIPLLEESRTRDIFKDL